MHDADYGTLPVVDAQGCPIGIVTDGDVCLAIACSAWTAAQIAVDEVMTRKLVTVALRTMYERRPATGAPSNQMKCQTCAHRARPLSGTKYCSSEWNGDFSTRFRREIR